MMRLESAQAGRLAKIRRALTMVELIAVIAVIGVMMSLLLPAVQSARETARQRQCVQNLKQIGVAVHNFHDVTGGLPPIAIFTNRPTIHFLLHPFAERMDIYEFLAKEKLFEMNTKGWNQRNDSAMIGLSEHFWFRGLKEADQKKVASAEFWRCPASNGSFAYKASPECDFSGPVSDYAAIIAKMDMTKSYCDKNIWAAYSKNDTRSDSLGKTELFEGPFRVSLITWSPGMPESVVDPGNYKYENCRNIADWKPRDNFSWIKDGLSNQIFFAEKHIPAWALTAENSQAAGQWNGGYHHTGGGGMGAYNTARPIAQNAPDLVIAPSPNFPLTSTLNENGSLPRPDQDSIKGAGAFGSSHPGVFNVCFGDGSVRTFSVDIDVDEFALLGRVQDGQMAVLP